METFHFYKTRRTRFSPFNFPTNDSVARNSSTRFTSLTVNKREEEEVEEGGVSPGTSFLE